jgi:hypothetical protein
MKKEDLLILSLGWLATNASVLIQLLGALVPVMALAVAAFALYVVSKKGGRK